MLKVMIAEDDVFISDMLEMALIEGGYEVRGIARTVREAIVLDARHDPDLAILDLRLAEGGLGTEIAAQIKRPGGPGILYATGNPGQVALTAADGEACLSKPYPLEDVIRSLEIVTEIASTGKALPPFPAGLELLSSVTL